jgi:hypothetical protein
MASGMSYTIGAKGTEQPKTFGLSKKNYESTVYFPKTHLLKEAHLLNLSLSNKKSS